MMPGNKVATFYISKHAAGLKKKILFLMNLSWRILSSVVFIGYLSAPAKIK